MPDSTTPLAVIERLFGSRKRFERFALLYVHDVHAVQDILMECYAYVWEHRDNIDLTDNVEAYMLTMIKHRCLDYLQRQIHRNGVHDIIATDARWELEMSIATLRAFEPSWLFDQEVKDRVKAALEALPERTRRIFIMSRNDGLSYREIADLTGVSIKTVEAHISRALRALRADLGDYFGVMLLLLATADPLLVA